MDCPIHQEKPSDDAHDHDHSHGCEGHSHGVHGHDHTGALKGDPKAKQKLLFTGCLTAVFMVAEIVGGLISGSLALIADAGHMLTDTAALWLAWYAMWAAQKAATSSNTFGFHRAKIVVAYTNGLALFGVIAWVGFEAVSRLLSPQPILSDTMLIVAALGLAVNIGCLWLLNGGGDGLNMRGARLHVIGDLLGSIAAVLAALIIRYTGWTAADPVLSLIMCAILSVGALRLVRQSLHILLQGTPSTLPLANIGDDLTAHIAGVSDIHHIHAWALDDEKPILTLHATLEQGAIADDVIAAIKLHLSKVYKVTHSTVEVEYGSCADTVIADAS